MLATFAELERDMIRERLADARAARRARGRRSAGRVPLGYVAEPRTKQLIIAELEAATVRWIFSETANGRSVAELATRANALGLTGKDGQRGHWYPRAVLRVLRNPVYAGLLPGGAPAIHTALVPRSLFDEVQSLVARRRTRTPTPRTSPNGGHNPFILRGLLVCERCGKTMTTSMSTALTKKSAQRAPRYYRCRTLGCAGGQVAATEVEAMAHEALRRPRHDWPPAARERLTQLAANWDVLWPANRRRALAVSFEQITWRSRTRRLLVTLRPEDPRSKEPPVS